MDIFASAMLGEMISDVFGSIFPFWGNVLTKGSDKEWALWL
jgi:hypothetical protein